MIQEKKKRYTLKAAERLKQRKKIDVLFRSGQKFSVADLRVVYNLMPSASGPRLLVGVGVSKRYFKKAVDRNLIKRRLREAIRLLRPGMLPGLEAENKDLDFFVLYTGKKIPDFSTCSQMMEQVINKLTRKLKA